MAKTRLKQIDDSIEQPQGEAAPKESKVKAEPKNEQKPVVKKNGSVKAERKQRSQKYQQKAEAIDKTKLYPVDEAIEAVKKASYSKFDGTVEIHINTAVKELRGLVTLPHSAGKKLRVLAFGKDAPESGADLVGDDQQLAQIEKGKVDFDVLVTTPEWMPKIARLAKILGPKGLMPSPKNGTVADNLKKTVSELQGGKTEYKTEKDHKVIHLVVGKVSQEADQIIANVRVLYNVLGKSKVQRITLAPSMGPGIRVNPASL